MTDAASLRRSLAAWGAGAALVACLLNGVWLACMIYLQGVGGIAVQAGAHPVVFRVSVGASLLLTVAEVPILLAFAAVAAARDAARALIGGALYALYIPPNLIGYFAFGRLAPILHAPGAEGSGTLATLVEIGHPLALTGNLPILGYGLLGLAWCLLASACARRGRRWALAAAVLSLSGALGVLGACGVFADVSWLAACCFLGGVVSLPALGLLAAALAHEVRS